MSTKKKIISESKPPRIASLYAELGRKGITLKSVCEEAGLKYNSVCTALSLGTIGLDRLSTLEETALSLPDNRKTEVA